MTYKVQQAIDLAPITRAIADKNKGAALVAIDNLLEKQPGPGWQRQMLKLRAFLVDGAPRFSIFVEGNSKLPFLAFSSLPGARFCPGAGDCLSVCYSFKAWRYPAAFCRQVQNTVLMDTGRGMGKIANAMDKQLARRKFRTRARIDFRLYVDGDYRTENEVYFWQTLLAARPRLAGYGYSKSLALLCAYHNHGGLFADNYALNISGGHRYDPATVQEANQLPCTRGAFVYLADAHEQTARELQTRYRQQTGRQAFACPGKCGECLPKGRHYCGDKNQRADVIIAAH